MSTIPACPQCVMENTYPDADNPVCADCGHEVDCKMDAGSFMLKDCFLKKA